MRARVSMIVLVGLVATAVSFASATRAFAGDPVRKCREAVVAATAKLAHARLVSLRKCEEAKRKGKLPVFQACATEPAVATRLAAATDKLRATIEKACGGADKRCGSADDVRLAAMKWPTSCPDFEAHGCAAPIASCADVPSCVACLADAAVSSGLDLVYAPFTFADPKAQKAIARCQQALAAAATTLADKRVAVNAKCLAQRLAGKHDQPCPIPGDGKSAGIFAATRGKVETKVCNVCGGPDKHCGGGDDLDRALIGVAPACPGVATCGGAIAGLADLVACFDCTAAARADCALAGAAPGVAEYPAGCAIAPPTPTPTITPTPTLTPIASPTLTASPTETPIASPTATLIASATLTATPEPTPSPVFCPAGAGAATDVTITLETAAVAVSGADVTLDYPPHQVRIPGVFDDAEVRSRVTDLTPPGYLLSKGSPNNKDTDADREPDHLRFTIVSIQGVTGAILKVRFDRCDAAALTTPSDYTCTVIKGYGTGTDGVTHVPVTCSLAVGHLP